MKFRTQKVEQAFGLALWADWQESSRYPGVGLTIHITIGNRGFFIDFPKSKGTNSTVPK